MKSSPRGPWYLIVLALVAVAVVVAAVLEVGPPSSSARVSHEVVTAANGVVQSTVTGSGNIEPGTQDYANFKTSGTLSSVNVSVGQHVQQGQLLATLDPTSAQLTVDQAQLSLKAAEDDLKAAKDGSPSSSGSSGSGSTSNTSATVNTSTTEFVSETINRPTNTPVNTTNTGTTPSTTSTGTTPSTTTTGTTPSTATATTPATATATTPSSSKSTGSKPASSKSTGSKPSSSKSTASSQASSAAHSTAPAGSGSSSSANTTTTSKPSPGAIASAQAQVDSAELTLRNAQTALAETRLYSPATGTIVSLESTSPGDEISAGSNSSASSGSSGAGSSGSSGSGSSGSSSSTAGSLGSSSSSSSSSGSGFAEIVNTNAVTMTVALSESDIAKVKVGQRATVTLDALTGVELAAHVSSISVLGSDSNGVVSYDVTLALDQSDSRVRPGMSASAAIVTQQAQGVNLPNSAVAGSGSVSTVNLLKNGKTVTTEVVVGLKGDSRTQIVSGLSAGQQVVVTTTLPSLGSSAGSSSSGTAGLGSRLGGGGFGGFGGGGGFPGGGFASRLGGG